MFSATSCSKLLRLFISSTSVLVCCDALAQDSPYRPGPNRYPKFAGKQAEPGIAYGKVPALQLPRTILYSVSPTALNNDAKKLVKMGFNAFFVTGVASEWSTDVWGSDGEPWTIGRSDKNWQLVRKANERCKQLDAETFLTLAFSHRFDWFDDLAWQKIENNFRQYALFAKTSGCSGVAIDIEYIGEQYCFEWEGYDYKSYSRADLVKEIRKRARQIAVAVLDAFPEAKFLTFPEQYYHLGTWLHVEWIEEAARRNAPGGVHFCTEYTYRRPNIRYMFAHAWLNNHILQSLLTPHAREYWMNKCSIAEGLWPFGEDPDDGHGVAPTPEEFRQAFAASLMAGSQYNWVYSHDAYETLLGRSEKSYPGQAAVAAYMPVIRERLVATNAGYVRMAQDLRSLKPHDFGAELSLALAPGLIGPHQSLVVEIMPKNVYDASPNAALRNSIWQAGERVFNGEAVDMPAVFPAQTDWLLLGPFANKEKKGYTTPFAPEQLIDLNADIVGLNGTIRWTEYHCPPRSVMVSLANQFQPSEEVCAYALCYAKSDRPLDVQMRVGGNDSWKLWVGGKLVREWTAPGRIYLDCEVVPVSLPAGTTPVLLKVCNNTRDWGFVLRIADQHGKPVPNLKIGLKP